MEKLTKEAKDGLEWAAKEVVVMLNCGMTPEDALDLLGVKGMADTYHFLEYLRETGREKLINRLTT